MAEEPPGKGEEVARGPGRELGPSRQHRTSWQPSALRLICRSSLGPEGCPPLPPLLGQLDPALSPPDPSLPEVSTRCFFSHQAVVRVSINQLLLTALGEAALRPPGRRCQETAVDSPVFQAGP